ncbi:hypothetical protein ACIQU4_42035 [Streptomyces sp. NPDC090741]|uniref:hypothetical protein n=1 Tax=Streptomyces sp. NPDC090741 TaxID=3365967 RepID=UPI00381DAE24
MENETMVAIIAGAASLAGAFIGEASLFAEPVSKPQELLKLDSRKQPAPIWFPSTPPAEPRSGRRTYAS